MRVTEKFYCIPSKYYFRPTNKYYSVNNILNLLLCVRSCLCDLGHSMADVSQGEEAVRQGASLITHLFNAMLPVCPFCRL